MFTPRNVNYALSLVPHTTTTTVSNSNSSCTSVINKSTSVFERYVTHACGAFDDYFVRSMFDPCGLIVMEICEHMVCVMHSVSNIRMFSNIAQLPANGTHYHVWRKSQIIDDTIEKAIARHLFNEHGQEMDQWYQKNRKHITNNGSVEFPTIKSRKDALCLNVVLDSYQYMSMSLQCTRYKTRRDASSTNKTTSLPTSTTTTTRSQDKSSINTAFNRDLQLTNDISFAATLKYDESAINNRYETFGELDRQKVSEIIQNWTKYGTARRVTFRFLRLDDLQLGKVMIPENLDNVLVELHHHSPTVSPSNATYRQELVGFRSGVDLIKHIVTQNIRALNKLCVLSKSIYHKITSHTIYNFYYALMDHFQTIIKANLDALDMGFCAPNSHAFLLQSNEFNALLDYPLYKSTSKYVAKYAPWFLLYQKHHFTSISRWIETILKSRADITRYAQHDLDALDDSKIGATIPSVEKRQQKQTINERIGCEIFGSNVTSGYSIDCARFVATLPTNSRALVTDVLTNRMNALKLVNVDTVATSQTVSSPSTESKKMIIDDARDRDSWCMIPNAHYNDDDDDDIIFLSSTANTTTTTTTNRLHPSIDFDTFLFHPTLYVEPEYTSTTAVHKGIVEIQPLLHNNDAIHQSPSQKTKRRKTNTNRRTIGSDDEMVVEDDVSDDQNDNILESDSMQDDDSDDDIDDDE